MFDFLNCRLLQYDRFGCLALRLCCFLLRLDLLRFLCRQLRESDVRRLLIVGGGPPSPAGADRHTSAKGGGGRERERERERDTRHASAQPPTPEGGGGGGAATTGSYM